MSVKKKSTAELLEEADVMRVRIFNKAHQLGKVAGDYDAVKRIAEEIKEMCK